MNKLALVLFVIVYLSFALYFFISTKKRNEENLDRQFYGIVESVRYDEKDIPYVKVMLKEYYLDAGYNFERKIEKGDSIFKRPGSNVYKLAKRSGEVILFKN